MDSIFWLFVTLATMLVIFVILIITKYRNKEYKTDYYALFILGLVWLVLGLPEKNYSLSTLGLIFLTIGLAKKKEWKSNHRSWSELSPKEKKIKLILIAVVLVMVIAGIVLMTTQQLSGKS